MVSKIEKGTVFCTSEFQIDDNLGVYLKGIPVGTLKNNLKWFKESPNPDVKGIKEIVYLENYEWGVKQFRSLFEEFEALSKDKQEQVLDRLMTRYPGEFGSY